jgi:hypothetical protein
MRITTHNWIQLNNQYQGIWNNYVDVHNTTWKYYVLEI